MICFNYDKSKFNQSTVVEDLLKTINTLKTAVIEHALSETYPPDSDGEGLHSHLLHIPVTEWTEQTRSILPSISNGLHYWFMSKGVAPASNGTGFNEYIESVALRVTLSLRNDLNDITIIGYDVKIKGEDELFFVRSTVGSHRRHDYPWYMQTVNEMVKQGYIRTGKLDSAIYEKIEKEQAPAIFQ